jgi:hypothetical protein
MQGAFVQWHAPRSAAEIAENILRACFMGMRDEDKQKVGLRQPGASVQAHFSAA